MHPPMHENPSAGKFEPPPEPSPPKFEGSRFLRVVLALVLLGTSLLLHELRSLPGRGWISAAGAIGLFALAIVELVISLKRAEQREGADPYTTPTHLTH
jgi:hypothetical protein